MVTGKKSVFPLWDKIGSETQFWERIGFFYILGNLLENYRDENFPEMGTFWEIEMECHPYP